MTFEFSIPGNKIEYLTLQFPYSLPEQYFFSILFCYLAPKKDKYETFFIVFLFILYNRVHNISAFV